MSICGSTAINVVSINNLKMVEQWNGANDTMSKQSQQQLLLLCSLQSPETFGKYIAS